MSEQEVRRYFDEYVFGFIRADIQREIDLARSGDSGGNFLAALGLLCYTEFMGSMVTKGRGSYTKMFRTFFRMMGEEYRQLIDEKDIDVYRVFRSGMAHAYFAKDCDIKMLDNDYLAGIVVEQDGEYLFIVEKYFEDFMAACEALCGTMIADPDPYLPST